MIVAGLEVLIPQGEMLPPEVAAMAPKNWKMKLPLAMDSFICYGSNEGGITAFAGAIAPNY